MINPKRKIHSYNNPNKYWDETRTLSTTPRLRGGNAPSILNRVHYNVELGLITSYIGTKSKLVWNRKNWH